MNVETLESRRLLSTATFVATGTPAPGVLANQLGVATVPQVTQPIQKITVVADMQVREQEDNHVTLWGLNSTFDETVQVGVGVSLPGALTQKTDVRFLSLQSIPDGIEPGVDGVDYHNVRDDTVRFGGPVAIVITDPAAIAQYQGTGQLPFAYQVSAGINETVHGGNFQFTQSWKSTVAVFNVTVTYDFGDTLPAPTAVLKLKLHGRNASAMRLEALN